jgi:hypothetical protein
MRASLLAVAAAAVLAAAVPSAPGFAQGVSVEVPGADVRIGNTRDRDRDRYRGDRRDRDRVTVGGRGCKTVTVRERLPDGTRVTRRKSSC